MWIREKINFRLEKSDIDLRGVVGGGRKEEKWENVFFFFLVIGVLFFVMYDLFFVCLFFKLVLYFCFVFLVEGFLYSIVVVCYWGGGEFLVGLGFFEFLG